MALKAAVSLTALLGTYAADAILTEPTEPINNFSLTNGLSENQFRKQWVARVQQEERDRLARLALAQQPVSRSRGSCHRTPEQIAADESGGSYTAENDTSTASGKYQYLDSTWNGYGGYQSASDAPPEVQEERFKKDYAVSQAPWNSSC